jgi:DNA-binding MarR family transcriptional regulator
MPTNAPTRTAASAGFDQTEATFHALLRTLGRLRQMRETHFARFGISGPQWGILEALQGAEVSGERELRLTDLGRHLQVQPPGITGLIDRMERSGLVRRSRSHTDQRARRVSLTPAGRGLVAQALEDHAERVARLFGGMQPAEMARLHGLLTRMADHLQTLTPRGPLRRDGARGRLANLRKRT